MNDIQIELADWVCDKADLLRVRTTVFVEEQKVPAELEIDDMDETSEHIKAVTEDGEIIGTARLLPDAYIGRMCVLKPYRNQGVGQMIMLFLIEMARQRNIQTLQLNAQLRALKFYEKCGFQADSEIFMEADIAHRHMSLPLSQ